MPMPVITARGIRKRYGDRCVLDRVDLDLDHGEVLALLGPNGAGKTTTIEILLGFIDRDEGDVAVLGQDPTTEQAAGWRSRIGVAVQSGADHPKWRVSEFVDWVTSHYEGGPRARSAADLLEAFGLAEHSHKRLMELSGGLRRRLDLAAALAGGPDLLILDEPTTGLDPEAKRAVHDILADQVDTGTALLLATHDLAEAERLADRIVILHDSRVLANASPEALRHSVEGSAEVTWTEDGTRNVHPTDSPEEFLRDLLHSPGVTDVEVRRQTLEDAYLALVTADGTPDGRTAGAATGTTTNAPTSAPTRHFATPTAADSTKDNR